MQVLELPPKESFKTKVNLESLYGICLYFPYATSTNAFITLPNTVRLLFILPASLSLSPKDPVIVYLSDPAKSTKCRRELFTICIPFSIFLLSIVIENSEWDLELSIFIYVSPTCLYLAPNFNKLIVSSELFTNSSYSPSI